MNTVGGSLKENWDWGFCYAGILMLLLQVFLLTLVFILIFLLDGKEKSIDSTNSSPLGTPRFPLSPSSSHAFFSPSQRSLNLDTEEVERFLTDSSEIPRKSRLSKPLVEIIRDSESLSYFLQYLEAMNVTNLAKCLLDIDNLTATSATKGKKVSWKCVKGVGDMQNNSPGQIRKELSQGLGYANSLACDISGYCEGTIKKTYVRTPTEAKLRVMQEIEIERLDGLFELSEVFESTVDALRLFSKYFSYSAPFKIILGSDTFEKIVDSLGKDTETGVFAEIRGILFTILENEFYSEYLKSYYHGKYQMSVLTGTKVCISDILYNEAALFYFMEFLEQEGHRGLLEFWMGANNFRMTYESTDRYDADHAQTDAMVLYDKYFSLQATQSLQLGDKVRFAVEQEICREAGTLPSCFDQVQRLILRLLDIKFLEQFLQSQVYFNYLSELISTVNAGPATRPGGSDCSSEVSSVSAPNPLLASDDRKGFRSSSMDIDTRHLYDPDSLWRREKYNSLTFGRVNSLGRFETAMEQEPDRKLGIESRISKAVKKLVNLEEDKSKEEMAWQVAEMYIKDVTNITMPSGDL